MADFKVPNEAETCTVSSINKAVCFGGKDGKIYTFPAAESREAQKSSVVFESIGDKIASLAIYHGKKPQKRVTS